MAAPEEPICGLYNTWSLSLASSSECVRWFRHIAACLRFSLLLSSIPLYGYTTIWAQSLTNILSFLLLLFFCNE